MMTRSACASSTQLVSSSIRTSNWTLTVVRAAHGIGLGVSPNDVMLCPHEYEDTEVGCDDCGTHPAVRCDQCGQVLDLIYEEDPRDA
jgi:hypothetical protein